jgi:Holliday junction resolvase RusA-like endonuclease
VQPSLIQTARRIEFDVAAPDRKDKAAPYPLPEGSLQPLFLYDSAGNVRMKRVASKHFGRSNGTKLVPLFHMAHGRQRELDEWRGKIANAAAALWNGPPSTGPMKVLARFVYVRPKTVTPGERKYPIVKPDVDKLRRAVCDALTGICYVDDAQIIVSGDGAPEKLYGPRAGVKIVVEEIK